MERPKGRVEKIDRKLTDEIVYLDEMRRYDGSPQKYPEDVSDMAIQLFQTEADMMQNQGIRPEIMDLYEQYDNEESELNQSCAALAEELLKLKDPGSELTFEDFVVDTPAVEVLDELRKTRAGGVLAADDKQLAIPSNGEYYPILDIKKQDAKLTGVGVRAWGWSDRKYIFTNDPGEPYQYPRDCLVYPGDEKSHSYELDITFSYDHPDAGYFNEKVSLTIGSRGNLQIGSDVWASVYAETGYEGHGGKSLKDASDEDVAAFADLIAKVVGDEPETVRHYNDRKLRAYIDKVANGESRDYLLEWLDNSHAAQVKYDLGSTSVGDQSLLKALFDPDHAEEAHKSLVEKVDEMRRSRNEPTDEDKRIEKLFGGDPIPPWRDLVVRED